MSSERNRQQKARSKERRLHALDWTFRAIGATSIATMLMVPASMHELSSADESHAAGTVVEPEPAPVPAIEQPALSPLYDPATGLTRDTGMDTQPCYDFKVCGTDLGQPFLMPDGSVGYLFGDTFAVAGPFLKGLPDGADQYRAQTMLRSTSLPVEGEPIVFDSAPGLEGTGTAPETLGQWHILMNDGVSLPNGDIVVSYQHTAEVEDPKDHTWYTDYAGLAVSHDNGKSFELTGPTWSNDMENNLDPYQMWSMQYNDADGYVYIISDRAGRRKGPMMLFRARWDQMLESQDAYEYWNGTDWGSKADAQPLQTGHYGEPCLRKLSDGTWVMSYADYAGYPKIVTKTLLDPSLGLGSPWSDAKVQISAREFRNPYGGGIDPRSTPDYLVMMISTWQTEGTAKDIQDRNLVRYDVSHLITNVY